MYHIAGHRNSPHSKNAGAGLSLHGISCQYLSNKKRLHTCILGGMQPFSIAFVRHTAVFSVVVIK